MRPVPPIRIRCSSVALVLALAVALALAACGKTPPNEEKRMPKLVPPPQAKVASDLRIAVEIDGAAAQAIDGTRLEATRPNYEDKGKRAWRLDALLGQAVARERAVIAVTGEKDVTIVMKPARGPSDAVPVLMANLRGDVVAAMVEPTDPFPAYHGQGGRLQRKGDPLPRIAGVTKIRVYQENAP